jgi:hypothetical protein
LEQMSENERKWFGGFKISIRVWKQQG